MNSMLKYALITCLTLLFIHPHNIFAKECNDLILILDPENQESADNTTGKPLSLTFLAALQEATAPIITTSNIVNNFCFWKTTYQEELRQIKQEAITTYNQVRAQVKAQVILKSMMKEAKSKTYPSLFLAVPLSLTDLTDNNWDVYLHKQADLILLIPKNYSKYNNNILLCGFQPNILTKASTVSPTYLLKQLIATTHKNSMDIVAGIESMLIKKLSDDINQKSWNIYMIGHGSSAKKKKDIEQKIIQYNEILNSLQESAIFWEKEKLQATQISGITSWLATINSWLGRDMQNNNQIEQGLQRTREKIKSVEKIKNKLSTLFESLQNAPDEEIIPQTAFIAGLNFNDFSRLMTVFNNHIRTSFLYYQTCFGGGHNRIFVNETLKKISANFIVVASGINETSTQMFKINFQRQETNFVLSEKHFTHFFTALENFFGQPPTITNNSTKFPSDPIATIVKTIITPEYLATHQPFVRIPSVGIFSALAVDKEVKILTNSIVKAHELEGKTISIIDPKTKIVLVYPHYMAIPVHFKAHVSVISPTENKTTKDNNSIHIFEKIISDGYLSSLIGNFISLNISYSTITFVIKQLTCLNTENSGYMIDNKQPVDVNNVIIHIKSDRSSKGSLDTFVIILFNFNNETYSYRKSFADLEHNESFWDIAENFPFTPLDNDQLNIMAKTILNTSDLKSLTLSDIIEQLENQINKETVVQKPGSLKKIMLSQQLQAIEKAASSTTLTAQEQWLQEQIMLSQQLQTIENAISATTLTEQEQLPQEQIKPAITILTTLKRNNDNLINLKQDIEELTIPYDITEQEKTDLLNTITRLQQEIKNQVAALSQKRHLTETKRIASE
jgi:hypothetical protein